MLAIIDCAINRKSVHCFNEMVKRTGLPITYHDAVTFDLDYLLEEKLSGMIVFGSATNVCDNLSWHHSLKNLVMEKLKQNVPIMGICFGHQLIANAFGAEVGLTSTPHSGCREVEFLDNYMGIEKGQSFKLIQTHQYEVKTLPDDLIHLGTSPECKYDILTHKSLPYISFQCHPEASKDFVLHADTISKPLNQDIYKALLDGSKIIDQFISYFIRDTQRNTYPS